MTPVHVVFIKGSWYIDSVFIDKSKAERKAAMLEKDGYHCEVVKKVIEF